MSNFADTMKRYDARMAERDNQPDKNKIPPMKHPLSRGWDQPDPASIVIDNTHALMTMKTFLALKEYSGTFPTGVYEGKMWRRHDGLFDREFRRAGGKPTWYLCWYGYADEPGMVSNNFRLVLLLEGELPEAGA